LVSGASTPDDKKTAQMQVFRVMEAVGHGSNRDFIERLGQLGREGAVSPRPHDAARPYERHRRAWGVTTEAIVAVLSGAGELRSRDIHAAVQAMCEEPVPLSSVKNCLAKSSRGTHPLFERVGRGRYRLAR
jgi:hypothetical protein